MRMVLAYIWSVFLQLTPKSVVSFYSKIEDSKLFLIFVSPLIMFFLSHETLIYTLILFVFVDLWTGFQKSVYLEKKELSLIKPKTWINLKSFASSGARRTWNKIKDYFILVVVIFFLENNVIGITIIEMEKNNYTLTSFFVILLCVTEVYSVFENREVITGKNLLKQFAGFLPEKIRSVFSQKKEENVS